jgi:sugar lactone lactonase YvrE
MTALDLGGAAVLFVSNVLNGTVAGNGQPVSQGTVLRILLSIPQGGMPQMVNETIIGSGFSERTDAAALVIGPTGLGLASNGTLYVADTLANRIAAIPGAVNRTTSGGTGTTVAQGNALNGPLGLAVEANGGILTVNSNDGNLVETSPQGQQLSVLNIDSTGTGGGTLFGLAVVPGGVYFVNDGNNTLNLLRGDSAI